MSEIRLIAVLGYSDHRGDGLHEICAARLRRAETEARAGDVVLLSGWSRHGDGASEADQMARAWNGAGRRIVVDRAARSTLGNVRGAASLARTLNPREIVLVTSGWHSARAAVLLRWALRRSGSTVRLAKTDEPGSFRMRARELACWAFVPLGLLAVTKATRPR